MEPRLLTTPNKVMEHCLLEVIEDLLDGVNATATPPQGEDECSDHMVGVRETSAPPPSGTVAGAEDASTAAAAASAATTFTSSDRLLACWLEQQMARILCVEHRLLPEASLLSQQAQQSPSQQQAGLWQHREGGGGGAAEVSPASMRGKEVGQRGGENEALGTAREAQGRLLEALEDEVECREGTCGTPGESKWHALGLTCGSICKHLADDDDPLRRVPELQLKMRGFVQRHMEARLRQQTHALDRVLSLFLHAQGKRRKAEATKAGHGSGLARRVLQLQQRYEECCKCATEARSRCLQINDTTTKLLHTAIVDTLQVLEHRLNKQQQIEQKELQQLTMQLQSSQSEIRLLHAEIKCRTYDREVVEALRRVRNLLIERKREGERVLIEMEARLEVLESDPTFLSLADEMRRCAQELEILQAARRQLNSPLQTPDHQLHQQHQFHFDPYSTPPPS